ncbi:hypothetical protein LXL04_023167 [Taraxacum kok-saghyz]
MHEVRDLTVVSERKFCFDLFGLQAEYGDLEFLFYYGFRFGPYVDILTTTKKAYRTRFGLKKVWIWETFPEVRTSTQYIFGQLPQMSAWKRNLQLSWHQLENLIDMALVSDAPQNMVPTEEELKQPYYRRYLHWKENSLESTPSQQTYVVHQSPPVQQSPLVHQSPILHRRSVRHRLQLLHPPRTTHFTRQQSHPHILKKGNNFAVKTFKKLLSKLDRKITSNFDLNSQQKENKNFGIDPGMFFDDVYAGTNVDQGETNFDQIVKNFDQTGRNLDQTETNFYQTGTIFDHTRPIFDDTVTNNDHTQYEQPRNFVPPPR